MTSVGVLHPGRGCGHRKYRMSCEQIAELIAETDGRCQICGILERYMYGVLHIDHDKALGYWAVRGLLCPSCNSRLDRGGIEGPEVDRYLANPWHSRLPYSHLIDPEIPDERPDTILDQDTALLAVSAAANAYRKAREIGSTANRRATKADLVEAVRAASWTTVRQKDIAVATNGLWSSEQVSVALRERRQQPNRLAEAVANSRRTDR